MGEILRVDTGLRIWHSIELPDGTVTPGDNLNNDSTNWNVPNLAAINAICRMSGLEDIKGTLHPELADGRVFASGKPRRD